MNITIGKKMVQQSAIGSNQDKHSNTLEEAFANFSEASNYLTDFYKGLEHQVARLNDELTATKIEKNNEYLEKEKLASRLANLLHVLPGGVVVIDGDGVISQVNPAALDLLGEPLEGELWREIVERAFAPRWDDGHDITLYDGRSVNIATQSLESEPGQILLIKDVSENRLLQEQFSDLKRLSAMGEMAASLAHQVRTPLSSAILYASNLSRNGLDEAVRQRFSEKLLSRLQNLETLVEDMLLFARGGRFDAERQSLNAFVCELEDSLKNKIEEYQCDLEIRYEACATEVTINAPALISCIHNLVENAVQSVDHNVKIGLAVFDQAGQIQIDVSDNGSGIPSNIQDRLFEPFFSTRSHGTGLGLAVVDAVVRAHNGKLSFDTEENKGTTFHIRLPVTESNEVFKARQFTTCQSTK